MVEETLAWVTAVDRSFVKALTIDISYTVLALNDVISGKEILNFNIHVFLLKCTSTKHE